MTEPTYPLIHERMALIMAEVEPILKEQEASAGGGRNYKFRGIDDAMFAIHPLLAKHQVYITSQIVYQETTPHAWTAKSAYHNKVIYRFTFHTIDGSETSSEVIGEAIDGEDKGMAQSYSSAYKELMWKTFCIPSADQQDSDQAGKKRGSSTSQSTSKREPPTKKDTVYQAGDLPPEYVVMYTNDYEGKCHLCTQLVSVQTGLSLKLKPPETYTKRDGTKGTIKYHIFHHECFDQFKAKQNPPANPVDKPTPTSPEPSDTSFPGETVDPVLEANKQRMIDKAKAAGLDVEHIGTWCQTLFEIHKLPKALKYSAFTPEHWNLINAVLDELLEKQGKDND